MVDPPRSGCHPRLLQRLLSDGPPEVFSISCNPDRFLAELAQLESAYRLEKRWPAIFSADRTHRITCLASPPLRTCAAAPLWLPDKQ
ncbi:MAG: hypothetical protein KIS61_11365 [Candidatus Eremiobacteraeota bacterium]|nr:hypothetical protein [Candidatus Eremiobacteraeota bacterium]